MSRKDTIGWVGELLGRAVLERDKSIRVVHNSMPDADDPLIGISLHGKQIMTSALQASFERLARYLERAKAHAGKGEYAPAMADMSEVAFISRQLWNDLAKANKEKSSNGH